MPQNNDKNIEPGLFNQFQPITVCGLPASGKSFLISLFDGHPEIYCRAFFHDSISSLLCLYPKYSENADFEKKVNDGSVNKAYYLRKLLTQYGEYYSRLEIVGRRKFFAYTFSADKFMKVPIDFDFYRLDKNVMTEVFEADDATPLNLFNIIYKNLMMATNQKNTDKIKYCVSMANNDLSDYELLINTYKHGKVIFVNRNLMDCLGSTILIFYDKPFSSALQKFFRYNAAIVHEYARAVEKAEKLARKYPERMRVVDFEGLFTDRERIMRDICQWLKVDFNAGLTKPTIMDQEFPAEISSRVQDSMVDKLSKDDFEALLSYVSAYTGNRYDAHSGRIFLHPRMFASNFAFEGEALALSLNKSGNLFYGPYLNVPEGDWRATYLFEAEAGSSLKNLRLFIDCVDGAGRTYFSGHLDGDDWPAGNVYDFMVDGNDKKFEFRAALVQAGKAEKLLFKGVSLEKIPGIPLGPPCDHKIFKYDFLNKIEKCARIWLPRLGPPLGRIRPFRQYGGWGGGDQGGRQPHNPARVRGLLGSALQRVNL